LGFLLSTLRAGVMQAFSINGVHAQFAARHKALETRLTQEIG
jgi:hypothetical protein